MKTTVEMRECKVCKVSLPLTEEWFPKSATRKSGKIAFRTECIECRRKQAREYRKKYYKKNREKVLQQNTEWSAENDDKVKVYQAKYRNKKKQEAAQ